MKRLRFPIIVIALLLSFTACNKNIETENVGNTGNAESVEAEDKEKEKEVKDNKNVEGATTNSNDNTNTAESGKEADDSSKKDLESLSEELALQIVNGDFNPTYELFSTLVKKQITVEALKKSWDDTIQSIGKFIKIQGVQKGKVDVYDIVDVTLQYEKIGIQVRFTYNNNGELDGFYFTYADITEGLETNDLFEETEITLGEEYPIQGILTLPKNQTKPPVVILVPGSGTHDADETIGPNKPFRDLAHGLAKQGIASIRYTEKPLQYPTLTVENPTIHDDSLNDAKDAINYALECEKIDNKKIFIIGHSLGGMMAPKLADDYSEVAGIVILAGSPRKLEDIILDQEIDILEMENNKTEEVKQEIIVKLNNTIERIKNISLTDSEIYFGLPASYWHSLNEINIPEIAKNLSIPIFIAQGNADFQVFTDKDYKAWQDLLSGKSNVSFHLYENLNHLFMQTNGKKDVTEYSTPGHVEQVVIDDIAKWIQSIK